ADAFEIQHAAAYPADQSLALPQPPGQAGRGRRRGAEALLLGEPAVLAGLQAVQAIVVAVGHRPETVAAPGQPGQVAAPHAIDGVLGQQPQLLQAQGGAGRGEQQGGQQPVAYQATTSARLPLDSSQFLRSPARFLASSMSMISRVVAKSSRVSCT